MVPACALHNQDTQPPPCPPRPWIWRWDRRKQQHSLALHWVCMKSPPWLWKTCSVSALTARKVCLPGDGRRQVRLVSPYKTTTGLKRTRHVLDMLQLTMCTGPAYSAAIQQQWAIKLFPVVNMHFFGHIATTPHSQKRNQMTRGTHTTQNQRRRSTPHGQLDHCMTNRLAHWLCINTDKSDTHPQKHQHHPLHTPAAQQEPSHPLLNQNVAIQKESLQTKRPRVPVADQPEEAPPSLFQCTNHPFLPANQLLWCALHAYTCMRSPCGLA
jgi:hypothetical protein